MAKATQTANENAIPEMKIYQTVNESTGEIVDIFKYLEGHPRQYRFDAKEGVFSIFNGNDLQKIGKTFSFQPIGWRIFSDDILKLGRKNWAEIFFVDEKNCVSAILFHGYSVDALFKLIEPLFYDDLTLSDVVLTVEPEKKENVKIQPKGTYYIASFSYVLADKNRTKVLKAYADDKRLYRSETTTDLAEVKTSHRWHNPFEETSRTLESGEGESEVTDSDELPLKD